jgi:hypothetical protein
VLVDATEGAMTTTIVDVLPLVRAYYKKYGYPNVQLIVLMHGQKIDDAAIQRMTDHAIKYGDRDAAQIGLMLLKLSMRQRKRVAAMSKPTPPPSPDRNGKRPINGATLAALAALATGGDDAT